MKPLIRPNFLGNIDSDYRFEIATSREDFEAAYRLLMESYVAAGLTEKGPQELLITNFSAMPSTFVLVAKFKNTVIGTLTITTPAGFGLPCFEAFPNTARHKNYLHTAEISLVAISSRIKENLNNSILFWPLWNFALRFCRRQLVAKQVIAAVSEEQALLLRQGIGLKHLSKISIQKGEKLNSSLHLMGESLARLKKKWSAIDENSQTEKGYTWFYREKRFVNFKFLKVPVGLREVITMKPEDFLYFFQEKSNIIDCLPTSALKQLKAVYEESQYSEFGFRFFSKQSESRDTSSLRRYNYFLQGTLKQSRSSLTRLLISQISEAGFRADLEHKVSNTTNLNCKVMIDLHDGSALKISAQLIWTDGYTAGFKIKKAGPAWFALIQAAAVHSDGHQKARNQADPFATLGSKNSLRSPITYQRKLTG